MKLIALRDIAVNGQHCATGASFEADGAAARYLIDSRSAVEASADVAPVIAAAPVAEDRRQNPREAK